MRVKNIFAGIMMALMLVALPFVSAQEEMNVPVVAGTTSDVAMTHVDMDAAASTELGGLTGHITLFDTVQRWVKNALGDNIYFTEDTVETEIQDFTMYMFPTGETVTPEIYTTGDLFKVSEYVEINGVSGMWNTNIVNSEGADSQIAATPALSGSAVDVTLTNGVGLQWDATSIVVGNDARIVIRANEPDGYVASGAHPILACDTNCPSELEVEEVFGGDWTVMSYIQDTYGTVPVTYTMVAGQQSLDGGVTFTDKVIADMNGDGVFEFSSATNGFEVTAQSGQALALIPGGVSYDIYGLY